MGDLRRSSGIEHGYERLNVGNRAALQRKALRGIHKGVHGCDKKSRSRGSEHDWNKEKKMSDGPPEPIPCVQVDPQEYGFEEKGEGLHKQRQGNGLAGNAHKTWPQQAELQTYRGSSDDADGYGYDVASGPAPREKQVVRIISLYACPFGECDHDGNTDTHGSEYNMKGECDLRKHSAV